MNQRRFRFSLLSLLTGVALIAVALATIRFYFVTIPRREQERAVTELIDAVKTKKGWPEPGVPVLGLDPLDEFLPSLNRVKRAGASEIAVAPLLSLLGDSDLEIRYITARVLGEIANESDSTIEVLGDMMNSDEESLRSWAAFALWHVEPNCFTSPPQHWETVKAARDYIRNHEVDAQGSDATDPAGIAELPMQ